MGYVWLTWRNLFAGRRAYATGVLILLPAIVAGLIAAAAPESDPTFIFRSIAFHFSLRFMIFLLALIFGIALTSGEIEEGTVGYIYLSAVPRWMIVLIQILVTGAALSALTFVSLLATALAAGLNAEGALPHLWRDTTMGALIAAVGIYASLTFYVTCGLAFRRPLAASVIVTFFWEMLVTGMPLPLAAYTVTNNLRALMLHLVFDGDQGKWFRYVKNYTLPDYGQASFFLSVVVGFFLVTAMVAIMNRSVQGKEAH